MTLKGFTSCAILFVLAAPAWAQGDDPMEEHFFPPELVMKHQRTIGLTAEQREIIKTDVQTAQATFTDIQWELHDEMETMKELVESEQVDEGQVLDQLEKILTLERQIKRAQLTLMVRIKNTLTPDQQKKLWELALLPGEDPGGSLWPW